MPRNRVPRSPGRHRWRSGLPAVYQVMFTWEHAYPDAVVPADLGHRPHQPRHGAA